MKLLCSHAIGVVGEKMNRRNLTFISILFGTLTLFAQSKDKDAAQILIPKETTWINGGKYSGYKNLKKVEIPSTVDTIGFSSFSNCTSLEKVKLNEGLRQIHHDAFENCTSLKSISIPSTVIELDHPFNGCTNLVSIDLSKNTNFIYLDGIVYNKDKTKIACYLPGYKKKEIEILSSVNEIREGTFVQAPFETITLTLPDNTENTYQIARCKVKHLTVKGNPTLIPRSFCYDNKELVDVVLPQSVKKISSGAFAGCTSLKVIDLSKTNIQELEDGAFAKCASMEKVILPESLLKFGRHLFSDCSKLESITLPSKLISIPEETFSGCTSLKEVVFSASVKSIEEYAFDKCMNLKQITFAGTKEKFKKIAYSKTSLPQNLETVKCEDGVLSTKDALAKRTTNFHYTADILNITLPESKDPSVLAQWLKTQDEYVMSKIFSYVLCYGYEDYAVPLAKAFEILGTRYGAGLVFENPIGIAIRTNNEDIALNLIKACPDMIRMTDGNGQFRGCESIRWALDADSIALTEAILPLIDDYDSIYIYHEKEQNECDFSFANPLTFSRSEEMDELLLKYGVSEIIKYKKNRTSHMIDSNVNVRSKPGLTGDKLGKLNNGDKIVITGQSAKRYSIDNYNGSWLEIEFNGQKGYIFEKYVYKWEK